VDHERLVTYYLLFAMLGDPSGLFPRLYTNPGGPWMAQMARNLTDTFDGLLRAPVRYVLMDRDTKFRPSSRRSLPLLT